MHLNVHSSTTYQDREATWVSTDRSMDKEDVVHVCNGILLSHEKEWNNAIFSNMGRPRDHHTEYSQIEKDKHYTVLLTCGI